MKASPLKDAFNAGEFSPLMAARIRIDKYQNALSLCENMIPMVQGGVTRRPGTIFASEVKDSSKATRLIPFEFSVTQAYMLEFGNQYIRFYRDWETDRKSTRLNSSHEIPSRMPSSA